MSLFSNSVLLLVSIGLVSCDRDNISFAKSTSDDSAILANFISIFFHRFFENDNIFVSFIFRSTSKDAVGFQSAFLFNLFESFTLKRFAYKILNELDVTSYGRDTFNLIFVDNAKILIDILNEQAVQNFHIAQKFLIIIRKQSINEDYSNTLNDVYALLWNNGLLNSYILIEDATKIWTLNTFFPFQDGCNVLSHMKIASFTGKNISYTSSSIDELYPNKLINFNGCPIFIAVSLVAPFTIYKNTSHGLNQFSGIEIFIIDHVSKRYNFTAVYKRSKLDTDNGKIFKNGTVTGNMGLVTKGIVNLTVGGLIRNEDRASVLSPSNWYLQSSMGFIYKEGNENDFTITNLLAPFRIRVWLTVLPIATLPIPLIMITKKWSRKWRHFVIGGRMNRSPILNMWAAVLGLPISNPYVMSGKHFGTFARTLTILWITLWFLIRSSYEGLLYTNMQSQRSNSPYDEISKVLNSNCKIVSAASTLGSMQNTIHSKRIMFDNSRPDIRYKNFYDNDIDGVVLSNDLSLHYFNLMYSPNRRLSFTKDRLFVYFPTILFRKKSILQEIFNEQMRELVEAGIMQVWTTKYMDYRNSKNSKIPKKMRIEHITGAFQICSAMYIISIITFILEFICIKCKRIKVLLDFLTY